MKMKIKLDEWAYMPLRGHETDAGLDLRTPFDITVPRRGWAIIDTGVHVEIPEGYGGFLESKSGLNVKHNLISHGTIDVGYTGSIVVKLYNLGRKKYKFKAGDKITQLVIKKILIPELELVDELTETERGNGGFGSTGA